ncbi:MAG: TraR/DksA family transcriptional regulator [Brevinematales bacterium]|nr:TraR/DksA family transcriptional regulator [Brevinematales bacterium]
MTQEKLKHYEKKLLAMQDEILTNIIGETSDEENPFQVDGDLADKAEAFSSVAISEGLSTTQKETLELIRKALQRIKNGNFGSCLACNIEIETERLEAIPYAETCKKHMSETRYR